MELWYSLVELLPFLKGLSHSIRDLNLEDYGL